MAPAPSTKASKKNAKKAAKRAAKKASAASQMASVEGEQHEAGPTHQPPSRLLRMPKEILNEICRIVVADPPQTFHFDALTTDFVQPCITQACQTLRKISLPMFYGQNTIELRVDFSTADLGWPYHYSLFTAGDDKHRFAKWLQAVSTEVGTLLRNVSLISTNTVTDQPADLHTDMVWEEQNSRCLALFLVSHGVDSAFIKHSVDADRRGIRDPDLMSFKNHMDIATSFKTMWQTMPKETMFFAKTVAEKSVPVMERELPALNAAFKSTRDALILASDVCYEKTQIADKAMRRRYAEVGRKAPKDYRDMGRELPAIDGSFANFPNEDSMPEWMRLWCEARESYCEEVLATAEHEPNKHKSPPILERRILAMKLLALGILGSDPRNV